MTATPEIDTEAAALLEELERLADELTVEQAAQDDRYARRLAVFRRLTDKGVTQARIATAAKITPMVTNGLSTGPRSRMSFAMNLATCVPNTANAMKFQNAAHNTALNGVRTRVATTVAIEFAASWKPLTKSKINANPMTEKRSTSVMLIRRASPRWKR